MENESGKRFKSRLCEGCAQTIESKGLYSFAIDDQNFKNSLDNDMDAENVNPNCSIKCYRMPFIYDGCYHRCMSGRSSTSL